MKQPWEAILLRRAAPFCKDVLLSLVCIDIGGVGGKKKDTDSIAGCVASRGCSCQEHVGASYKRA